MDRVAERGSRGVHRVAAAMGALTLATAVEVVATAQDHGQQPIQLTYRVTEGCPDEASFLARVRSLTTKAQLAPPGTGAEEGRAFAVDIDAGHPASGRLSVGDADHPEGTRRVQAETCAEVADALALVVALAIDPRAAPPPSIPPSPADGGFPPLAETAVSPPIRSAVTSPSAGANPPPAARSLAQESIPPATRGTSTRGVLLGGLDAAIDVGVSPVMLFGLSPYVGWEAKSAALFAPSLRLAFHRAQSGTVAVPDGAATFTWTAGRLDACPLARTLTTVRLTACTRIEAGALEVSGGAVVAARTALRVWLAAGALARAEWTLFDPLFLNLEASASVRLTNDRFVFLPNTTVYQVPLVGVGAGTGLGAHFL
jgi:hypothetical protein